MALLSVKELVLLFPSRDKSTLYTMIRKLKKKYKLIHKTAEIPMDVIIKEYGLSMETIITLIKKGTAPTVPNKN